MDKRGVSVFTAGLLQGIVLVSFPAASTILTSPSSYNFSNTQYGSLFVPQAILAIVTAFFNSFFCTRLGTKKTLTIGLIANFFSMVLLTTSIFTLSYWQLLIATTFLGIGYGTVIPTINRLAEHLWPKNSDEAVLALNGLVGVGTTLAPILIAVFSALNAWWGLPLSLLIALLALFFFNLPITLPEEKKAAQKGKSRSKPIALIAIFACFAFLYGIIETINGNWITIYMSKELGASITLQSIALTAFWGMLTFGRFFFALITKFFSQKKAFQVAPFIAAIAFILIAFLISTIYPAILTFGLMGFGCSALLPLTISFGTKQLSSMAAAVPGMIISTYLLGYGVAAFGAGPLQEYLHISLKAIFGSGTVIATALGGLAIYIIHRQKEFMDGSK